MSDRNAYLAMLPARFMAHVDMQGPIPEGRPDLGECWIWTAAVQNGYGVFQVPRTRRNVKAHRYAYEMVVGEVPDGYQLDHLCRNRGCVRASHLEAVTPRVNTMRSLALTAVNAAKTHCLRGHPFAGDNLYVAPNGRRKCRTCLRQRDRSKYNRAYYQKHRDKIIAYLREYRKQRANRERPA